MGGLLPKSDLEKDGLMTKGRSYYTYTGLMTTSDPYFNDLNNIYKYTERGLSIFRCNGDISNLPVQEAGLLEHIQRDDKNNSLGSQFIVQTYYSAAGIPRRPTRGTVMKATISMDKETVDIINRVNPRNLSEWICDLIKNSDT